jgi:hypothetical protein
MPTLTTYFLTVTSSNVQFLYIPTLSLVSPTTNWPAGNLWSWVEQIPSRPTPHNPATVVNPTSIQASNDGFRCTYDQDSANYNPPQNTWTVPTTAGLYTFTDQLVLSNLAVKPNSNWTITNVSITIRKQGEGNPYSTGTTYAEINDALFQSNIALTQTGRILASGRGAEKVGTWPDVLTDFTYDLNPLYTGTALQNLLTPSTWQNTATNIRFAARIRLSNTAKEAFTWGIDSVFINITYTLPSITPYPINGYFQTGYHALVSQPKTISPYSTKTVETVNLQIPTPGTKISAINNIQPYGQVTQEILGRHRLSPGNVNITNYPILSTDNLGQQKFTTILNLQDRSIVSIEKLGLNTLTTLAYIYPYSIQTLENKLNYAPVIYPDDSGTPVPSIRTNANITPKPVLSIEKLGLHTLYSQAFIYPYSQISNEILGLHTLYSQAFIYPHSQITNENLGLHTLYSQAFIIPYPVQTVEKTGLHLLNSLAFILPYPITSVERTQLHTLLYGSFIYPYSIISNEQLGLHELQREIRTLSFLNQVHYPSYEMGYFDCVAISRDINNDPYYDMSFGSLNADYMFSINNMNLNYKQNSNFEKRLAGEGPTPTTFKIDKRDFSFDFTLPVKIESWGDVDPSVAALYDYCIQGYKGSTNNFVGRILASDVNSAIGSTDRFVIDNISDFMSLGTGYNVYVRSDDNSESTETLLVSSINKASKTIIFTTSSAYSHTPYKSYLWANGTNPGSNREPSFSMFSAKEGLFSGCLVDSLTLRIVPGDNIIANISVKFTDLDRKYQKNFYQNFDTIMSNINDRKPNYLLNASQVSVSNSQATTSNYTFNLGDAKTSKLFHGYQEYDLRDFEITEMTIDFKNNLEPVYSLNSKSSDATENFNKNLQPYAYYSNGRTISGTIKYNSPMKPWLLAERLSGPSNINKSGIKFNFGPFTLELPQVTWSPDSTNSTVDSVQNHSISWSVIADSLSYDPYPEPTGEL